VQHPASLREVQPGEGRITSKNIRNLRSVVDVKEKRRRDPFPPGIDPPMMMTVTIDGVTTVPEFGGWAC
jgi:hypothetical protein